MLSSVMDSAGKMMDNVMDQWEENFDLTDFSAMFEATNRVKNSYRDEINYEVENGIDTETPTKSTTDEPASAMTTTEETTPTLEESSSKKA